MTEEHWCGPLSLQGCPAGDFPVAVVGFEVLKSLDETFGKGSFEDEVFLKMKILWMNCLIFLEQNEEFGPANRLAGSHTKLSLDGFGSNSFSQWFWWYTVHNSCIYSVSLTFPTSVLLIVHLVSKVLFHWPISSERWSQRSRYTEASFLGKPGEISPKHPHIPTWFCGIAAEFDAYQAYHHKTAQETL